MKKSKPIRTAAENLKDSAWNIPMVLGLVDAGRFDTVYAVLLLLVNCGMQIMFSGAADAKDENLKWSRTHEG